MRFLLACLFCLISSLAFASQFFGSYQPIPKTLEAKMIGVTWHSHCPVSLKNLSYLKLSYWGFDNKTHRGVLIVNKRVAENVIEIFHELYIAHFPIQQMQPMYVFKGSDLASMKANNTSGFNCRTHTGSTKKFSKHAYGLAIDINPLINPYVKGKTILPPKSSIYLNRKVPTKGLIAQNSFIVQTFKKFGWQWGGNWKTRKDYQHFQI